MLKILTVIYILATSSALIILKWGAKAGAPIQFAHSRLQLNINGYTVSGILLYGISFLLYTYLISKYDLGYIIPLTTAFVYVLIFVGSAISFKESFTAIKLSGIVLILAGVALLNIKH